MSIASAEDLIRHAEGCRLRVYDDATGSVIVKGYRVQGHPTIGIGRNLAGRGITREESDALFAHDMVFVRRHATKFAWFEGLNEPRQAVVLSMIFQLGPLGFRGFRRMIQALEVGNFEDAHIHMLESKWAREDTPGRANHLAGIMLTGTWEGATV